MGKIILACPGECCDDREGIFNGTRNSPLTEKGMNQAYDLGEDLAKRFEITKIFTSPKAKAMETVRICSTFFTVVQIKPLDYLVERNHGILEGRPYLDVRYLAKSWHRQEGLEYILEAEGAETYPQLYDRAKDVYRQMMEEVAVLAGWHEDVLFVGYGGLFGVIEAVHYARPWGSIWDNPCWKNCEYRVLE